jgi:hypothetical protein
VVEIGDPAEVAQRYLTALLARDAERVERETAGRVLATVPYREPARIVTSLAGASRRHGDGAAEVLGIEIRDEDGHKLEAVHTPARIVVTISVRAREAVRRPIVGFLMRTEQGVDFAGTNTARENLRLPALEPLQALTLDFHLSLPELAPQRFSFAPALSDGTLLEFRLCDLIEGAATLEALPGPAAVRGYLHIPCLDVRRSLLP